MDADADKELFALIGVHRRFLFLFSFVVLVVPSW